jgi:hypothetical protein
MVRQGEDDGMDEIESEEIDEIVWRTEETVIREARAREGWQFASEEDGKRPTRQTVIVTWRRPMTPGEA